MGDVPAISFGLMGDRSIGEIASAIGKQLLTDECISKKLSVSYARVLIEVDVTKELKHQITIRDPARDKVTQHVEYEWKPPFCTQCNKVGHMCKPKNEKPKNVYVKKQTRHTNEVINIPKSGDQQDDKGKLEVEEDTWIKA